jgi:hypothetical protein
MQYASQYDRMKEHFLDGKQLTRMEALNDLGIMNPTARISELRANGFDIQTRMIGVYNRWDTKVKVAQWFLPDEDKPLVPTRKNRR